MLAEFWLENLKGKYHSEDLGLDERMILKSMLEKQCSMLWTGFFWLRMGTAGGFL
jgi:hypothetical protein